MVVGKLSIIKKEKEKDIHHEKKMDEAQLTRRIHHTVFIPRVELYNSGIIGYIHTEEMYVVCIAKDIGQGNQAARNVLTLI